MTKPLTPAEVDEILAGETTVPAADWLHDLTADVDAAVRAFREFSDVLDGLAFGVVDVQAGGYGLMCPKCHFFLAFDTADEVVDHIRRCEGGVDITITFD